MISELFTPEFITTCIRGFITGIISGAQTLASAIVQAAKDYPIVFAAATLLFIVSGIRKIIRKFV